MRPRAMAEDAAREPDAPPASTDAGDDAALRRQLIVFANRTAEVEQRLLDLHEQLAKRDELLGEARALIARLESELRFMKQTRVWRVGLGYWALVDGVRRLLRGA